MNGLVNAETNYYRTIGKYRINVDSALRDNELYCDKLFELYHSLSDPEERTEIEYEINYLIKQARALRKIHSQLNQGGTA